MYTGSLRRLRAFSVSTGVALSFAFGALVISVIGAALAC